jgi:hypothetical protein
LIAMAWETFGGSASEMHIMIHKIGIHHANKHNRPKDRPSTRSISAIPSRSSVALGSS